jgi:hypothetical protein
LRNEFRKLQPQTKDELHYRKSLNMNSENLPWLRRKIWKNSINVVFSNFSNFFCHRKNSPPANCYTSSFSVS